MLFIPLYLLSDMSFLLEQDPDRRERGVPCVPFDLLGEPGGLQAVDAGGDGQDQGGEASEGSGQEAENLREPEALGQRPRRPEKPGLRGRSLATAVGRRGPPKAGVLWQVWQNTQGRHQHQHRIRGKPKPGKITTFRHKE